MTDHPKEAVELLAKRFWIVQGGPGPYWDDWKKRDRQPYLHEALTFLNALAHLLTAQDVAEAVAAERERCAKVAENAQTVAHLASDMKIGIFPRRSDIRDFIAAAIRKGIA